MRRGKSNLWLPNEIDHLKAEGVMLKQQIAEAENSLISARHTKYELAVQQRVVRLNLLRDTYKKIEFKLLLLGISA